MDYIASRFRSSKIPADAIILALFWFAGIERDEGETGGMGSLLWDRREGKFANPMENIAEVGKKDFKIIDIQ